MSEQKKSMYNSLDEMEEELSVKKIGAEAVIFYLDKTKNFEERIKVFEKYGDEDSFVYEPIDEVLFKIFEAYCDGLDAERRSNIECIDIINWWIDYKLKKQRIKFVKFTDCDKIKGKKRNYIPSKIAIERLRKYYTEKLFIEGIARFQFDW